MSRMAIQPLKTIDEESGAEHDKSRIIRCGKTVAEVIGGSLDEESVVLESYKKDSSSLICSFHKLIDMPDILRPPVSLLANQVKLLIIGHVKKNLTLDPAPLL